MIPRVVFQHTPKCAGSSVREALGEAFGWGNVRTDAEDRLEDPQSLFQRDRVRYFAEARALRPVEAVVSGHFPIRKYAHLPNTLRVGILRHPVDRHISHYHFWLTRRGFRGNSLLNHVTDNNLDLFEAAELPAMRRYYTGMFFEGAAPEDFDLLMLAEELPQGLKRLSELLGRPLAHARVNVTAERDREIGMAARRHAAEPGTRARLGRLLEEDVDFYERARHWACAVSA